MIWIVEMVLICIFVIVGVGVGVWPQWLLVVPPIGISLGFAIPRIRARIRARRKRRTP